MPTATASGSIASGQRRLVAAGQEVGNLAKDSRFGQQRRVTLISNLDRFQGRTPLTHGGNGLLGQDVRQRAADHHRRHLVRQGLELRPEVGDRLVGVDVAQCLGDLGVIGLNETSIRL